MKHYITPGPNAGYPYASYREENNTNVSVVLNFGYRSEPKSMPGFSFRAGFSPTYYDGEFVPYYPYLSIGYKFN